METTPFPGPVGGAHVALYDCSLVVFCFPNDRAVSHRPRSLFHLLYSSLAATPTIYYYPSLHLHPGLKHRPRIKTLIEEDYHLWSETTLYTIDLTVSINVHSYVYDTHTIRYVFALIFIIFFYTILYFWFRIFISNCDLSTF